MVSGLIWERKEILKDDKYYLNNGSHIIQELDNVGVVKAAYIYGLGADEPLVMIRNGSSYYYCLDGLGSVTEITDTSGDGIEKYKYDPFGETTILDPVTETVRDSSSAGNYYMYTGRQLDEETGLYYYRNRYYDTETGRFTTADPIRYGDGLNLYMYTRNNPVNLIDPSGTKVRVCLSKIASFPIYHRYVLVESRKKDFNGSWGFDYYPKDLATLDKVLQGQAVQGQIRKDEHGRQRKPKCRTVAQETYYDRCIYYAAQSRRSGFIPRYQLGSYDCRHWARDLLADCGIYAWDVLFSALPIPDTAQIASYNIASDATSTSDANK